MGSSRSFFLADRRGPFEPRFSPGFLKICFVTAVIGVIGILVIFFFFDNSSGSQLNIPNTTSENVDSENSPSTRDDREGTPREDSRDR